MFIITPQQSFPSHQAFNPLMEGLTVQKKSNCHLNKGGDKVVTSNNNTSTTNKAHNKPCRSMNMNTSTKSCSHHHHHHQAIKNPTVEEMILKKMMHHCGFNNLKIDSSSSPEQQEVEAEAKAGAIILERRPIHHDDTSKVAAKVSLDVAGFTIDDIAIQVDNHIIGIAAERTNRLGDVFQIQRKFRLDKHTADEEDINASITDGVLEIVVGKKKSKIGPRVISISTHTNTTVSSNCVEKSKDNDDDNEEKDDVDTKSNKNEEGSKLEDNTDVNSEEKMMTLEQNVETVTESKNEKFVANETPSEAWEEVSK